MPAAVSADDLVTGALKALGVIGAGDALDADAGADGLVVLNDLIDTFATQRLTIYATARNVYALNALQASYTIGPGGNFNQARPMWIPYVGLIIQTSAIPQTEIPLDSYPIQQWASVQQKQLQSALPQAIYYDHTWSGGLGNIYLWPVPLTGGISLVLYTPTALTEFADRTTTYTFPPGYARMLRLQLAMELAPEYGRPMDPVLAKNAIDALADIKRANANQVQTLARVDQALTQPNKAFNWLTGTPVGGNQG